MGAALSSGAVQGGVLTPEAGAPAIPVGSPAWYAWLERAASFTYAGAGGSFTAHKEQRSATRVYWRAYRRVAGRLRRAYLGRSAELTPERLAAAAAELAGAPGESAPPAPPAPPTDPDSAESLHLLATKLAPPPPRAGLIVRPELAARLDAAVAAGQRLILISAPAGSGKSTLVAEWQRERGPSGAAWLTLDETDNHLGRALAYLIAAVEAARPGVGAGAWALLRAQAARPPTHAILTALLNALAGAGGELLLVLDDYHALTLQPAHEAVAFLLDHAPPRLHVVILTRADPPLPLARLRGRGQLAELRSADLRFTDAEAARLLGGLHRLPLAPDELAMLQDRTEGWAAGLHLAALSLARQPGGQFDAFLADFGGSHSYVFDYLAEEVFRRQPEHVRSFLMRTAILERMCGPLCDALVGGSAAAGQRGQAILEELDHANLFLTRLDGGRRWYRYSHLFRDFLLEELERATDAAERDELFRRAAAWFHGQGQAGEAIGYALGARAWADALRCMTPLMASERFYAHYLDWPRWVAALPDSALAAEPDLCRRLGWILSLTGHAEAAARPLAIAERVWRESGDRPKVGEVLGIRSLGLGWRGDIAGAIGLAEEALALIPPGDAGRQGVSAYVLGACHLDMGRIGSAADWLSAAVAVTRPEPGAPQPHSERFLSLGASASLARAHQLRGDLQQAASIYRDVIRRMGSDAYLQLPSALVYLGTLCYEWGDLPEAERLLREGMAVAERIGRARYWPGAWAALARVRWATGDAAEAQALASQAAELAGALANASDIAAAEALQVWLWLAQGDLAAAERWARAARPRPGEPSGFREQPRTLARARVQLALAARQRPADLPELTGELRQLLQLAEVDQRLGDRITISSLLALAHAAAGEVDEVARLLVGALRLGAPEGYIRTFADEGPRLRDMILALRAHPSRAVRDSLPMGYVARLLDSFPPEGEPADPGAALLSDRERAVLQHIAEGRSVQAIADAMVISVHTARTHVRNIYAKLGAHSRVEAVEQARALGEL